jgi:hypothetical protein
MSSTEQGVTPPAQEKGANPVIEQWRVTIMRVRPQLIGLLIFVIGLVAGLAWAYGVAPTIWTNAEPIHLHPSYQQEWVKMVADQYTRTRDSARAEEMLQLVGNAEAIIDGLIAQNSGDSQLVGRLNAIRPFAPGADNPELAKLDYGGIGTLNPAIVVALILIIGALLIVLWGMYGMMLGMIFKSLLPSRNRGGASAASSEASQREAKRRSALQAAQAQQAATPPPVESGTPPVAQFMSAYLMGDDYYDDSFSIEDASGGFLGETGAGISETIGVGAPKKVTAVEVWLFDKNDIKTVTKVIMSQHAYNDEALRAKLAPKGEAVMAEPGKPVVLETQTLRIVANIRNLEYGTGALPPNSFYENLTLDIAAYAKEGATSAPGTAIGDMYSSSAMQ